MATRANTATATFGGGCFWGVEEEFRQLPGVKSTTVGYSGGTLANPNYQDVCSGRTGHAEVVQILYDPAQVSYQELLDVFWRIHDPTTLDRQGPDVGHQYRSVIFYHTPQQQAAALAAIDALQAAGKQIRPVVTEVLPAGQFYPAEEYHQQYLKKRGLLSCLTKGEGGGRLSHLLTFLLSHLLTLLPSHLFGPEADASGSPLSFRLPSSPFLSALDRILAMPTM